MKIESFNFASMWMPLSQPEYDKLDNINGLLIKTAGYPGGLDSQISLGTITFKVLGSGEASVNIIADSFALNTDNANKIGSLASVNVALEDVDLVVITPPTPPNSSIPNPSAQLPVQPIQTPEPQPIASANVEHDGIIQKEILEQDENDLVVEDEQIDQEESSDEITIDDTELTEPQNLLATATTPFSNVKVIIAIIGIILAGLVTLYLFRKRKLHN